MANKKNGQAAQVVFSEPYEMRNGRGDSFDVRVKILVNADRMTHLINKVLDGGGKMKIGNGAIIIEAEKVGGT